MLDKDTYSLNLFHKVLTSFLPFSTTNLYIHVCVCGFFLNIAISVRFQNNLHSLIIRFVQEKSICRPLRNLDNIISDVKSVQNYDIKCDANLNTFK